MNLRVRFVFGLLVFCMLIGCASSPYEKGIEELRVRVGDVPLKTEVMLVAGSSASANFAQEVLDQKKFWVTLGYSEDQITCYFAGPGPQGFSEDRAHYLKMAPELAKCFSAHPKVIQDHLKTLAEKSDRPLYLYVTSHGNPPISQYVAEKEKKGKVYDAAWLKEVNQNSGGELEQFIIEMAGSEGLDYEKMSARIQSGERPSDVLFTPRYLKKALQGFAKNRQKIVVIQGCFSGGFVETPRPDLSKDTLASLPSITVLTASRHDRTSFGCRTGFNSTYFGGILNYTLERHHAHRRASTAIDWHAVYDEVRRYVSLVEYIQGMEQSQPQYFRASN